MASKSKSDNTELTYNDVMKITTSPAAERSRSDIWKVTQWMMKISQLFADMDKDIVYNVMKHCKCQITLKDSVVVKQGDKGNAFYVILHGQVSIFVKEEEKPDLLKELLKSDSEEELEPLDSESPLDLEKEEDEQPKASLMKSLKGRFKKAGNIIRATRPVKKVKPAKPKPDPRINLGAKVAELKDGKTFGELALQRKDNRRAASVVTDTDVVFLVVERDLYNKSIRSFQARELAKIRSFVDSSLLFNHWPMKLQAQVQNSITKLRKEPGSKIVQQGTSCDGLHFVIEGETKVVINSLRRQQSSKKQYNDHNGIVARKKWNRSRTPDNFGILQTMKLLSTDPIQTKRREGYAAAEAYQHNRHKELCLSGPIHIIGDIEQVLALPNYVQTVITETKATLFQINNENLTRLMKLATTHGKALLDTTYSTMKAIVVEKWLSRVQKFTADSDKLNQLECMITSLAYGETPREEKPQAITREEKFMECFLKAYVDGEAPLIKPIIEGSHYYKMLMRSRAEQRKLQQARGSIVRPLVRIKPINFQKQPRSVVMLKEAIKRHKTSDVDVIVPQRIDQESKAEKADNQRQKDSEEKKSPLRQHAMAAITRGATLYNKDEMFSVGTGTSKTDKLYRPFTSLRNTKKNTDLDGCNVLVKEQVERHVKTEEPVTLVAGKTLQFYSQHLKGRLDLEYEKMKADPAIMEANRLASLAERKLMEFYEGQNLLDLPKVTELKRLDEDELKSIKPGAKCRVERVPCRMVNKPFTTSSHVHVHHHMIEHN